MPILETERLVLRPLELTDAPAIQREFPHWEIVRFLNPVIPWPYPDDGAETYVRDIALPAVARGEAWHWSLRPKIDPDQLIGVISLIGDENENRGFWIARDWQRQGLTTEASIAVTDYWFDVLGKAILRAPKAVENEASRKISMRTGMRLLKTVQKQFMCGELPAEIWEVSAAEWRAARADQTRPAAIL